MGIHSIPRIGSGWAVRKTGAKRAIRRFETEAEAWAYALDLARYYGVTAFRHRHDGTVEERVAP